jgi:hypothetical protein
MEVYLSKAEWYTAHVISTEHGIKQNLCNSPVEVSF